MGKGILIGLFCLVLSCGGQEANDFFTVTKIEAGKDGKTLFLLDGEGDEFTTVISIPNGNYAEVNVGDKVKLDVAEVLDTNPMILITRSVVVLK
ncbi:hypothetical protein [Allomuricauda sp. M10]|uniref:hypothetical protein n=1 Tax=Allomuricauda sp. M10 TaxID=2683292 RepID=UPI001D1845C6|nr:hypothetical protein [Muricauda sp. M10]